MTELVSEHGLNISLACRLFGHCRQAYYQLKADLNAEISRNKTIVSSVRNIREKDPGIGGYKLWLMLKSIFGSHYLPGRDSFYALLRRHKLMLPPAKPRHTTNSNHRYRKWKNLIVGLVPSAPNQLWVSDITYLSLSGGDVCYLHLITDAYSHKVIGWVLSHTLRATITLEALHQAIEQSQGEQLDGLIHHSDRGVQYCCDEYIKTLQAHHISISMTEDSKPTDNAIAERVNGIIKVEHVYRNKHFTCLDEARESIGRFIQFYNESRPHMSIGYKTPAQVHLEEGPQERMWKKKIYQKTVVANAETD